MTIETVRVELENLPGEIIVVDGGSDDGTMEWLVDQKDIITIIQHNRGTWHGKSITRKSWGYFMNLGFKTAQGTYVCMLSDDCLVVPGAIANGIRAFDAATKTRKAGAMAFYWRNWPEQKTYWIGHTFGDKLFVNHGLYLNDALRDVGYADEENYFFYHADGDICLRLAEAGYETLVSEDSYIEHRSDANIVVRTSNLERQQKDWKTYENRWSNLGMPKTDWLEKPFVDPEHTAERYWQAAPAKRRLLRRLGR